MKPPDETIRLNDATSASLWWTRGLSYQSGTVGCIGQLAAADAASARELLDRASLVLAKNSCHWVIGPMDGDTWHSYRVITESSPFPLFPGEPTTDPRWAQWLGESGFLAIENYTSSKISLLPTTPDDRLVAAARRFRDQGVRVRSMSVSDWDAELEKIHTISLTAFAKAVLYTPLDLEDFKILYEKARPLADPRWIRIAEWEGQPVAFLFAYENPLIKPARILMVKTLAAVPNRSLAGLGSLMIQELQQEAHEAGVTGAVHCLQHESNSSLQISNRYAAVPIRKYQLFGKLLC